MRWVSVPVLSLLFALVVSPSMKWAEPWYIASTASYWTSITATSSRKQSEHHEQSYLSSSALILVRWCWSLLCSYSNHSDGVYHSSWSCKTRHYQSSTQQCFIHSLQEEDSEVRFDFSRTTIIIYDEYRCEWSSSTAISVWRHQQINIVSYYWSCYSLH